MWVIIIIHSWTPSALAFVVYVGVFRYTVRCWHLVGSPLLMD